MILESELFTDEEMKPFIRSYSFRQDSILQSIIELFLPAGKIKCDPCFNKGGFYRSGKIEVPDLISDIEPLSEEIKKLDCRDLPYKNNSISSILFDPPYITYAGKNNEHRMKKYGSFKNRKELFDMYEKSFICFHRILKSKGILIVKCQDSTYGPDMSLLHIDAVILPCRVIGFKVLDLFLLLSKTRPERRDQGQKRSRKYHSYFIVMEKRR